MLVYLLSTSMDVLKGLLLLRITHVLPCFRHEIVVEAVP